MLIVRGLARPEAGRPRGPSAMLSVEQGPSAMLMVWGLARPGATPVPSTLQPAGCSSPHSLHCSASWSTPLHQRQREGAASYSGSSERGQDEGSMGKTSVCWEGE